MAEIEQMVTINLDNGNVMELKQVCALVAMWGVPLNDDY